jgi:hypothetical protein
MVFTARLSHRQPRSVGFPSALFEQGNVRHGPIEKIERTPCDIADGF